MGFFESLDGIIPRTWNRLVADRQSTGTGKVSKEPELVIERGNEWVLKNVGSGPAKHVLVSIGNYDVNYEPGKPSEFITHKPIKIDKIPPKSGQIPLTLWVDFNRNIIRGIGRFGVTYENANGSEKKAFIMQADETFPEKPENVIFTKEPEAFKARYKRLRQLRLI